MTDDAAFLAAIADQPDDDLPRLAYADFLDDRGKSARAEFIRVQCELARLPATDPRRAALAAREAELIEAHRREWTVPNVGPQAFSRGFVEDIHTSADRFLAQARRISATTVVRTLRLVNADRRIPELSALPLFARIERLAFDNNTLGVQQRIVRFFGTADLPRLRSLSLRNNRLWAEGLEELGRMPVTAQLRRLDLSGNPFADAGAEVLADSEGFANLRHLVVRNDEQQYADSIHAVGAAAMARSRTLTKLRTLDLAGHFVGDGGLIDLAESENLANVVVLDLSANDIGSLGDLGFAALVDSLHLEKLRRLGLGGSRFRVNRLDRLAAERLAGWPQLASGTVVDLRGAELGPMVRETLLGSPFSSQFELDDAAEVFA